ncbi:hypothetical protein AN958_01099 [Leucoagaricus sp. SymC.cos]|nr:hypothetical protein AN958_01099 [Leucoagaricus sp. SymC.cos]
MQRSPTTNMDVDDVSESKSFVKSSSQGFTDNTASQLAATYDEGRGNQGVTQSTSRSWHSSASSTHRRQDPSLQSHTSSSGYVVDAYETQPSTLPNAPFSPRQAPAQHLRGPLFRKVQNNDPRNIVIFGETGTGKSSLINMLSDNSVATVSNLAVGCTFESSPYRITIDGTQYTLWDTAGLNEGDAGSVPADTALGHLRDLVEKLKDGLSLLVYCIRGARYRDIIKVNYDLFTEIICQGEVPVVIVVTGLENEERMEDWWTMNQNEFTSRGMNFAGHACVTTTKGKKDMFEEEYEESKEVLRTLIKNTCSGDAWAVDSNAWFQRITSRIGEYYDEYNGYTAPPTYGDRNRGGSEPRGRRPPSLRARLLVILLELFGILPSSRN